MNSDKISSSTMLDNQLRKRSRTSSLWKVFKRLSPGVAKCNTCGKILSYKTSNSNLKRHLLAKHYDDFDMTPDRNFIPKRKPPPEASTPQLIEMIKNQKILWDERTEGYGNSFEQEAAWKKIASELYPSKDETVTIAMMIETFDELKHAFTLNPQCEYAEDLSFLKVPKRVVEDRAATKGENNVSRNDDEIEEICERIEIKDDSTHYEPVSLGCSGHFENPDEDTLFLLSLVEEIRRVPAKYALPFKAELMMAFKEQMKKYK